MISLINYCADRHNEWTVQVAVWLFGVAAGTPLIVGFVAFLRHIEREDFNPVLGAIVFWFPPLIAVVILGVPGMINEHLERRSVMRRIRRKAGLDP